MTVKELISLLQKVEDKDTQVLARTLYLYTEDFITTEIEDIITSRDREVWIEVELPFGLPSMETGEEPKTHLHLVK